MLAFFMPVIFFSTAVNAQQVHKTISHQGVLLDNNGDPVEDDTYIFSFRIYADSSGGSALWESDRILTVSDGTFNAQLGSEESLDLPFDQQYWVGVAIDGGSELSPRLPLSSVPYAMYAFTMADSSVTTDKILSGSVTNDKLAAGAVTNNKLADGSVTDEKIAGNTDFTNHTSFGTLNSAFTEVSDSWTKLDIGTKTFQKIHDSSSIEVFLRSRVSSGSFSGASRIEYQLRINGSASSMSVPHYIFSSNTTEYVTLKAVFENLAAGEHEVEVWANTDAGTSTNVVVDPGGFRGELFVTESR
jgi:hypothetical protein